MKAAVMGASGYAGTELLRLCAAHPVLEVVVATGDASAGELVGERTPSLAAAYPALRYARAVVDERDGPADPVGVDELDGLDVVFLALPHGVAQGLVPALAGRVGTVVDLSADFRLKDPSSYPRWYGAAHAAPELLDGFVYGLPELYRAQVRGASRIAVPGCYPTAAALALAPFARAGLVAGTVIVDAASGVSGAGRAVADRLQFCEVDEDFSAYGLLTHRHTPEMEQVLGLPVLFTPHLAPMARGILATCYARPSAAGASMTTADALAILGDAYGSEPFIVVTSE